MRGGSWLACGVALLTALTASGNDRPTQLPPLLTPPSTTTPEPTANSPRGPVGEYDHSHLYLPNSIPSTVREQPETCAPLGKWWVNPAVELAWLDSPHLPTAVRLRRPNGTGSTLPGPVLATTGATANEFRPGFALAVGRFLGDTHTHAIGGNFSFTGNGEHTLGGPVSAKLESWFIGADANYRHNILCGDAGRIDCLAGYRFAYLEDELRIDADNRAVTSNPFHGGQVGIASEWRADKWYVGGTAKVAFGVVFPEVLANGSFVGAEGRTTIAFSRLMALTDSNQTKFAVLPTVNLSLGRQVHDHARLFAGYSFQYLTHVARLADVLNPTITALPTTDFWVQAINFGVELRY